MARAKSSEKRNAILQAATHEVARDGLGAATAKIAKRAGIASGTLFTYFASKEELLNELYLELKNEVYARINADFPNKAGLKERARRIWFSYLEWALEFPEKRKVSAQLDVSGVITEETCRKTAAGREAINHTLADLRQQEALRGLPEGFGSAMMQAMQEATMEFIAKQPDQRQELVDRAFAVFWKAVQ